MEKLINSIPSKISLGKNKLGKEEFRGFCLRYSTNRNKWVCGYGKGMKNYEYYNEPNYVEANDPVEAVAFFIELLNKNKTDKSFQIGTMK